MTYTYRSKSTPEQQSERDRQKLNRGLLLQRKDIADKSARIKALGGQLERAIAQAIWDEVPLRTAAAAAGVPVTSARSVGLAFEGLPHSSTTAKSHVQTLRATAQQSDRLKAERAELQRQQEQLVVAALETGLLETPLAAAVSGLTLERVNLLARQKRQNRTSLLNNIPDAQK
jgi:hypothetical protein